MRKIVVLAVALLFLLTLSLRAAETREAKLAQLSHLMRKGSAPVVKLSKADKQKLEELLPIILPGKDHIGKDRQWKVVYHDMDKGDFFQVDLKRKDDKSFDRLIWFHILYKQEKPKFYGSEDFEGYRGMGMKDAHYFIFVGNLEIRAVAASDEFENDKKIKDILRAFKLKDIENL
jgi:hypothetical protein